MTLQLTAIAACGLLEAVENAAASSDAGDPSFSFLLQLRRSQVWVHFTSQTQLTRNGSSAFEESWEIVFCDTHGISNSDVLSSLNSVRREMRPDCGAGGGVLARARQHGPSTYVVIIWPDAFSAGAPAICPQV